MQSLKTVELIFDGVVICYGGPDEFFIVEEGSSDIILGKLFFEMPPELFGSCLSVGGVGIWTELIELNLEVEGDSTQEQSFGFLLADFSCGPVFRSFLGLWVGFVGGVEVKTLDGLPDIDKASSGLYFK